MIPTSNLIKGEIHAIDKKRLPGSHRYSKQFYPPKFIKKLERHLIKRYPKLKIDVVEDETDYTVYFCTENNYKPVEGGYGRNKDMDKKTLDALRNGLEDSYWYGDDDEKAFNELVRKAEAFDAVLKAYDETLSEGHMADEVCNIIEKYESDKIDTSQLNTNYQEDK